MLKSNFYFSATFVSREHIFHIIEAIWTPNACTSIGESVDQITPAKKSKYGKASCIHRVQLKISKHYRTDKTLVA